MLPRPIHRATLNPVAMLARLGRQRLPLTKWTMPSPMEMPLPVMEMPLPVMEVPLPVMEMPLPFMQIPKNRPLHKVPSSFRRVPNWSRRALYTRRQVRLPWKVRQRLPVLHLLWTIPKFAIFTFVLQVSSKEDFPGVN